MSDELRAIPDDPTQANVRRRLDAIQIAGKAWFASDVGDYLTYAVDAHHPSDDSWTALIALEWPGRLMGSDDRTTLRVLMHPEDAAGLADSLAHTAAWLRARAELERDVAGGGKAERRPPPGR